MKQVTITTSTTADLNSMSVGCDVPNTAANINRRIIERVSRMYPAANVKVVDRDVITTRVEFDGFDSPEFDELGAKEEVVWAIECIDFDDCYC